MPVETFQASRFVNKEYGYEVRATPYHSKEDMIALVVKNGGRVHPDSHPNVRECVRIERPGETDGLLWGDPVRNGYFVTNEGWKHRFEFYGEDDFPVYFDPIAD